MSWLGMPGWSPRTKLYNMCAQYMLNIARVLQGQSFMGDQSGWDTFIHVKLNL